MTDADLEAQAAEAGRRREAIEAARRTLQELNDPNNELMSPPIALTHGVEWFGEDPLEAHERRRRAEVAEADRKLAREQREESNIADFRSAHEARLLEQLNASTHALIHEKLAGLTADEDTDELCAAVERLNGIVVDVDNDLLDARTELAKAQTTIAVMREQLAHAQSELDAVNRRADRTRDEVTELRSSLALVRESVASIIGGAGLGGARGLVPLPRSRTDA